VEAPFTCSKEKSSMDLTILYRLFPITIPFWGAIEFIFAQMFIAGPNRSSAWEETDLANST
jgi:hypothetical protein